ncbi:MAG TPA: hypothetical protein PKO19_14660, partial [Chitinophagales bacterium]|nr:hypothetical protein [Chitinophagales bacterium]
PLKSIFFFAVYRSVSGVIFFIYLFNAHLFVSVFKMAGNVPRAGAVSECTDKSNFEAQNLGY